MQKIWKLALLSVTFIFIDQFFKGTIESLIQEWETITIIEDLLYLAINHFRLNVTINPIVMNIMNIFIFIGIFIIFQKIWFHRKTKLLIKPLGLSLILSGITSMWLDFLFFKSILSNIVVKFSFVHMSFSLAEILIVAGLLFIIIKGKNDVSNTF